jgi:hypothetical protein
MDDFVCDKCKKQLLSETYGCDFCKVIYCAECAEQEEIFFSQCPSCETSWCCYWDKYTDHICSKAPSRLITDNACPDCGF